MRKLKVFLLAATVIGFFLSVSSCSKSNNSSSKTDSVFYSPWINLNLQYVQADTAFEQVINETRITKGIIDGGVVETYIGLTDGQGDTAIESAVDYGVYSQLSVGSMLVYSFTGGSGLFRYVIIPGTVLTTTGLTPQKLKSMNYAEITKLVGTPGKQVVAPGIQ